MWISGAYTGEGYDEYDFVREAASSSGAVSPVPIKCCSLHKLLGCPVYNTSRLVAIYRRYRPAHGYTAYSSITVVVTRAAKGCTYRLPVIAT